MMEKKKLTKEVIHEYFMNNFDSYAEKAGDDGQPLVPTMTEKRFAEVMGMLDKDGYLPTKEKV